MSGKCPWKRSMCLFSQIVMSVDAPSLHNLSCHKKLFDHPIWINSLKDSQLFYYILLFGSMSLFAIQITICIGNICAGNGLFFPKISIILDALEDKMKIGNIKYKLNYNAG